MSVGAQSNILEFIEQRGRVSRTEVFNQFNLVSTRVVEDALEGLQARMAVVRGDNDVYAPARRRRPSPTVAEASAPTVKPSVTVATPAPATADYAAIEQFSITLRAACQEQIATKGFVRRRDLVKAWPQIPPNNIDHWLYVECRTGRLTRRKTGCYGPGTAPAAPKTTAQEIAALFDGRDRWRREDIFRALTHRNLHTVSTTLGDLIKAGALVADEADVARGTGPMFHAGVVRRGPQRPVRQQKKKAPVMKEALIAACGVPPALVKVTEVVAMTEESTPANAVQVGGQHYKGKTIQPWDYIAANGLGFFEGNAVKYITRWRDKGGIEDLRKARHYLDKLIEVETGLGL